MEGGFSLRKYETAIVWSTSLSEKELEKELKLVQETISAEKGTYLKTDSWGRRQLAYPIKKQTEGVYFFLRWDGEERVTSGIDKLLRINESCLRYLTLRIDDSKPEILPPQPSVSREPQAPAAEAAPSAPEIEEELSVPAVEEASSAPAEEEVVVVEVEEETKVQVPAEEEVVVVEVEEETKVQVPAEEEVVVAEVEEEDKVQVPAEEEESAPAEKEEPAGEEEEK